MRIKGSRQTGCEHVEVENKVYFLSGLMLYVCAHCQGLIVN